MGDRYPGHPDGYAFEVETNNGSAMIVIDRANKAIRINSAGLNSNDSVSGGGSQVYQMAATFARNNGLTFLPDKSVEPVAQKRRISHMISSILRHGTSRHFDGLATFEDARTGETKTEVPGWKPGEDDHNLALLLKMEHDYVMEEARAQGIDLSHLTHDPVTDNIIDATTSSPLTTRALDSLVDRFRSRAGGVGETTLLRALVTGSALRGRFSDGRIQHLQENAEGQSRDDGAGTSGRELVSVARGLYYSRAPADAHSASARGVGESLSGRPGGAAAPLAEAARYVNRKLPGLIHGKTQLFPSLEALLASDYAREHPFSPQQLDALQSAEGFFDKSSGHSVIIAGNIVPRPGETATSAVTRVILHERVGHDGLDLLLGRGVHQKRWQTLLGQIPDTEMQAIAQEKGYEDIAGDKAALGLEWFARRVEKDPSLLEKQPLLKELWETLKRALTDFMAGLSPNLDALKGADLETNLRELITRARHSALHKTGDRVSSDNTKSTTGIIKSDIRQGADAQPVFDTATVLHRLAETPDTTKLQDLGSLFAKMAERPGIFRQKLTLDQLNPEKNRSLEESAELYTVPASITKRLSGNKGAKLPTYTLNGGEALGSITVTEKSGGRLVIDTSKVRDAKLSTPAYQAIYAFAALNGKTVVPDTQYLPDGTYRRVSQMLSSALRFGTTRHMKPHKEAKFLSEHWKRDDGQSGESLEEFQHNVGVLAWQEALLALEYQSQLGNYGYDPSTDSLYDASASGKIKSLAKTITDAEVKSLIGKQTEDTIGRVGPATGARTLLIAHWLAEHAAGKGAQVVRKVSAGRAPMKFLYSHPDP